MRTDAVFQRGASSPLKKAGGRFTIQQVDGVVLMSMAVDAMPSSCSESRRHVVARLARSLLRRAGGVQVGHDEYLLRFQFRGVSPEQIASIVTRVDQRIEAVVLAPLTPKEVEAALGITSRERLRWCKDGRLPVCGRAVVGRGNHRAQLPIFAVRMVEDVKASFGLIDAWRLEDQQRDHKERLSHLN